MLPKLTIEELKARPKVGPPCEGSPQSEWSKWDGYGCHICGARYHCAGCGRGTGMMGHYVTVDGFQGHWCTIANG